MNKIILSLSIIIPIMHYKNKNENKYTIRGSDKLNKNKYIIRGNNEELNKKMNDYMITEGKNKLSNIYFSVHVALYIIYSYVSLKSFDTELIELEHEKEFFHIEFIKNKAYNDKNFNKIIFYSPGIGETSIDIIIANTIKYSSSLGYNFCIFWKSGTKKIENNFHLMAKPEHYNKGITQLVERGYKNIFLFGISAGTYNVFKYITSNNIHPNVRAAFSLGGTLELYKNLDAMPSIWKKYFSKRLINRTNKSLNSPSFSKNDNLLTVINKISNMNNINLKENSELEKKIYTDINVPCLFLNAEDDPIIKFFNIDEYPILDSPNYVRVITKLGGHGSYVRLEKFKFKFCIFSTNIANYFFENFIIND